MSNWTNNWKWRPKEMRVYAENNEGMRFTVADTILNPENGNKIASAPDMYEALRSGDPEKAKQALAKAEGRDD